MSKQSIQGNKIHFTSLGCARNLVDSEVMLGILLKAGYEITPDTAKADYLVVNTCGFLASSRQESCDTIEALIQEKKKSAKMIVAGCMVQKHKEELEKNFSGRIHYYLGSGDVEKILEAIEAKESGEAVTTARSYLQQGEIPRMISTPKHYAYLKIAEGCAKQCAFCIIPKIKGPLKSKTIEQIKKEFNLLVDQGAYEIILIAQDLGDWGRETKEKPGLETLLKELLKNDRDFWLRLLYLYPDEVTDELIDIIKNDPRVCKYVDMPLQHIHDDMLAAMRRKTNKEQIVSIIQKLRKEIPSMVIRTSLMVGFPGESDEHFKDLVRFVQDHPLDNVGIFQYSKEEESLSAKMDGHISEEVKQARFDLLAKTQMKVVKKRSRKYLGQKLDVLIEGYHPESNLLMCGRFYGQCPEIDGQVIINDGRLVTEFGKVYPVEITQVADYDLIGRVIGPALEKPEKKKNKTLRPLSLV